MEIHSDVIDWSTNDVLEWLTLKGFKGYNKTFKDNKIDGKALLLIEENDLKSNFLNIKILGDVKKLNLEIKQLKASSKNYEKGFKTLFIDEKWYLNYRKNSMRQKSPDEYTELCHCKLDNTIVFKPEFLKASIALTYFFIVTWIKCFVMVAVHDRVPVINKYPPLPDIFLDSIPNIPNAFKICEWIGTVLLSIWLGVVIFHKHRFILLKRFFTLSGTIVLIRGITTLITSLDVPGTHLGCKIMLSDTLDNLSRFSAAYEIWKGAGISFSEGRTCGDYMFCGHTVAFTMLNFFITEYAPRLYLIHTFAWILNIFGIFFIVSTHEHYSIDVFIAFYITSRLFMYYHTLANNHALMHRDLARTRVWFPLFCFFESDTEGIVPNEYQTGAEITENVVNFIKTSAKHYLLLVYRSNLTMK